MIFSLSIFKYIITLNTQIEFYGFSDLTWCVQRLSPIYTIPANYYLGLHFPLLRNTFPSCKTFHHHFTLLLNFICVAKLLNEN